MERLGWSWGSLFFYAFHLEEFHREACNEEIVIGRINKNGTNYAVSVNNQKNKQSIFYLMLCGHREEK